MRDRCCGASPASLVVRVIAAVTAVVGLLVAATCATERGGALFGVAEPVTPRAPSEDPPATTGIRNASTEATPDDAGTKASLVAPRGHLGEPAEWVAQQADAGFRVLALPELTACLGGGLAVAGDSTGRTLVSALHHLLPRQRSKRGSLSRGVPFFSVEITPSRTGRTAYMLHARTPTTVFPEAYGLRGVLPRPVSLVARGLWDSMNLGIMPSATFASVRDALVADSRLLHAHRANGSIIGLRGGARPVLLVYVPHCVLETSNPWRSDCVGAHTVPTRRAVACAAASAIDTLAAENVEVDIHAYDACGALGHVAVPDGVHMDKQAARLVISDVVQRYACPVSDAEVALNGTRAALGGGVWATDANWTSTRRAYALRQRYECEVFNRQADTPRRAEVPTSDANGKLRASNQHARSPPPTNAPWTLCENRTFGPVERRLAAEGFEDCPACHCYAEGFYDECLPGVFAHKMLAGDTAGNGSRIDFTLRDRSEFTLVHHLCSVHAHIKRGCFRFNPTSLPPAFVDPWSPEFLDVFATMLAHEEAMPLCMVNNGGRILRGTVRNANLTQRLALVAGLRVDADANLTCRVTERCGRNTSTDFNSSSAADRTTRKQQTCDKLLKERAALNATLAALPGYAADGLCAPAVFERYLADRRPPPAPSQPALSRAERRRAAREAHDAAFMQFLRGTLFRDIR